MYEVDLISELGVARDIYNPDTWEVRPGGSVQPLLQDKFEDPPHCSIQHLHVKTKQNPFISYMLLLAFPSHYFCVLLMFLLEGSG